MDDNETTNGLLAQVLSDIDQLVRWAEADHDASKDAGALAQAAEDTRRAARLRSAKTLLEGCTR